MKNPAHVGINGMNNIDALQALLSVSGKKIVITTHHKPDADALGSSLALYWYLKKKGHSPVVISPTDYPGFLHWMSGQEGVVIFNEGKEKESEELIKNADMIFCLDFSALCRINEVGNLVRKAKAVKVLIDHHLDKEEFADLEFCDIKAAATAELVYELVDALGDEAYIDECIGACLYAGIMTDTGSFKYPSTSPKTHRICARLMEKGVDTAFVHRSIFDTNSENRIKFLGYTLSEKLNVLHEYRTAYIALTKEDLKRFDSKTGDTEGLVNYALSIEGVVFAAIIIDRSETVKLSFRSVGDFSVNEFAARHFEGGGHKNAAGGKSDLGLSKTIEKFTALLPEYRDRIVHQYKSQKFLC